MKYVFVGNRRFVLEALIEHKLDISLIIVVKGTYLEQDIENISRDYQVVTSKKELLQILDRTEFDVLVSNGCPYILPISKMKNKKYINIHPSFLPDLKGIDPVIGSILYRRNAGATCHVMSDEVDRGDIISQVKIPYTDDLDVSLLYQLSFIAEKECFNKAYESNFVTYGSQKERDDSIYYSRKDSDKLITFHENNDETLNKIRAFNNKSQGAYFIYRDIKLKVYDMNVLTNTYLLKYAINFNELQILFCYEDSIVFKKNNQIIKFSKIVGDLSKIQNGSYLGD